MLLQEGERAAARRLLLRRRDGILQVEDQRVGAGAERLVELRGRRRRGRRGASAPSARPLLHEGLAAADRDQRVVLVEALVLELDDAGVGRDFDSRLAITSVVTCTVSPWKSGFGKRTSVIPRLAIVVPTVVSLTEMPIIRPSVKSEFISGWPHSVSVSQIVAVDMERLRVEGQAGEEDIVHLRDGAPERMVEELRELEVLEIKSGHRTNPRPSRLAAAARAERPPAATIR